jgi:ribosomal protein S18 acetylase RimI-like enzyme
MSVAYTIVPMTEQHIAGFRETSDAVFRESGMYAFFHSPPIEQVTEFVLGVIKSGDLQFVAISDGRVIGWCDALVKPRPAMRHSAVLGIGVLSAYRGMGVGKSLLQTTLAAARKRGLTRIELFVRADNVRARRLYESAGFGIEGVLRKHMLVGGTYHDSYSMALLCD